MAWASTIRLEELIDTVEERAAGHGALDRLEGAAALSEELGAVADALLSHFVEAAREAGASWTQIGGSLGVTKQGAQQRFAYRPWGLKEMVLRGQIAAGAADPRWIQRFTVRARRAISAAGDEARRLNHDSIEPEHLLLGILGEPDGRAVKVLELCGHSTDEVLDAVEAKLHPGAQSASGPAAFRTPAMRALDLTMAEAVRLGHDYIGTEHILLGLMKARKGLAAETLRDLGLSHSRLSKAVVELLAAPSEPD
jgi:Clp amino terminal domain, pathogenicity island component